MGKYGIDDPALARRVKLVRIPPYSYDVQLDGRSIGGMQRQLLHSERGAELPMWGYVYTPVPPDILTADRYTANEWLSEHYNGDLDDTRKAVVRSLLDRHNKK